MMAETFNLKVDTAQKKVIQSYISKKLSEISSHSDDVLPEYVMVMVQNKKTREQVANDLVAFLGQELANTFSIWLWKTLDDFINGRLQLDFTVEVDGNNYSASTTNQDSNIMVDSIDIKQEAVPRTHLSSVIAVADNRYNDRYPRRDRRKFKEERIDDEMLDDDSARSRARELKLPTRILLSAVQEAAESTSKNIKILPEGKEMDMDEAHEQEEGNTENNNNSNGRRLLRPRRREKIPDVVREHPQDPVKFTVTFEKKSKRSLESSEEGNNNMNEMQAQELKKLKKVRCSFWPSCQKGELCLYHHPTEPCSYGENCLYIHPSIACKFGAKCTRKGCAYQHPPPVFSKPRTRSPILCKFGASCTKGKACPYKHPSKHNNKTLVSGKIPCKFGAKCTNKENCKFSHDDDMNGVTETTNMNMEATTDNHEVNAAGMTTQSEVPTNAMQ